MAVFEKLEHFEQRVQAGETTCTACHVAFPAGQKFCSLCGAKLTVVAPTSKPDQSEYIRCTKCNHFQSPTTKFCCECGTNMQSCYTTGREALDLPQGPKRTYVPPDHTQAAPVVREKPDYDLSYLNVKGT